MSSCCNCDKQSCQNKDGNPTTEACANGEEDKECSDRKRHCKRKGHHEFAEKECFRGFPCDRNENMSEEERENCKKWLKFDSLSADEQKELISKRKACIDKREAEMKAKKEEFEQKWANFDNLSIEEQKSLLDQKCRMGCKKPFGKRKHHPKGKSECQTQN